MLRIKITGEFTRYIICPVMLQHDYITVRSNAALQKMSHPVDPRVAQIQQELYHIYGCLSVSDEIDGMDAYWASGGAATAAASRAVVAVARVYPKYLVLRVVRDAALRVAFNAAQAAGVQRMRSEEKVEACCRSLINSRQKIRSVVADEIVRLPATIESFASMQEVIGAILCLLRYDEPELNLLKRTMPLQLLYVLYCYDRVMTMSRMTENCELYAEFAALLDKLGYTARYQALRRPVVDNLSEVLSVHSAHSVNSLCLPKELVGLAIDYCRLDVLSVDDDYLIIKRILA